MSASTFDTLKAARELEAAGMDRTQAEAVAQTMRDAAGADLRPRRDQSRPLPGRTRHRDRERSDHLLTPQAAVTRGGRPVIEA